MTKKKQKGELIKDILQDAASKTIKLDVRKGEYSYYKVRIQNPYAFQEMFTIVQEDEDPKNAKEVKLIENPQKVKDAVTLGFYD